MQINRSKGVELKDIPDMTEEEIQKASEEFYKIIAKNMDISFIEGILKENKQLKSILTELERWLKENAGICRLNQKYTSSEIYNLREDTYYRCLNKIQELKEKYK